jgi:membrane protein implicated in regulation of membrane protease activity
MSWLTDHAALTWLALALVLAAVEVATVDFFFLMLVGGALVAALVAALGLAFPGQVLVAVAVALVLLVVVRPALVRRVRVGSATLTGTAALVGREARVVETVSDAGGRIRLAGEVWSARTPSGTGAGRPGAGHGAGHAAGHGAGQGADLGAALLLPGRTVRVLAIEGATAVVTAAGPEPENS